MLHYIHKLDSVFLLLVDWQYTVFLWFFFFFFAKKIALSQNHELIDIYDDIDI